MSSFASLMALSATHTRESQQVVENALAERRRKEALQRKQQEEKEAKEREQEKKLRLRRLEEEKRNQERLQRLEDERRAREAALQRREDEQRDSLRYGPKKAGKGSGGGGAGSSSSGARRRTAPDDSDQDSGGVVLTREELRERKQQAERRKLFSSSKRPVQANRGHAKSRMHLAGGAMNIVTNQAGRVAEELTSSSSGGSVKDRLTARPNTLLLLNTKKRDKRTEDEIQMEVRASRKVLEGTEATSFTDWFTDKKKDVAKRSPAPMASPAPPSRPDTPGSRLANTSSAPSSQRNDLRMAKSASTPAKPTASSAAHRPTNGPSRASSSDIHNSSLTQSKFPKINKTEPPATSASTHRPSSSVAASAANQRFKRPRSPSLSESLSPPPPPLKKRSSSKPRYDDGEMDISSEIWRLFGKDRRTYTSRDVLSDDEDMEADATILEREEKMSARIAKREEMLALEEERRHEEEKRQRKKEKERAMARGR